MVTQGPLSFIWVAMPAIYQYSGTVATPLVVGIAGLALIAYSIGYAGMAQRIKHPGGVYAFVAQGLSPAAGLASAALALTVYVLFGAATTVALAGSMSGLLDSVFGLDLPVEAAVVLGTAMIFATACLRLRVFLWTIVCAGAIEALTILVLDFSALGNPADGKVSFESLDPAWLLSGSFALALSLCLTSTLGIETAANYADDVRQPRRTIPRAVMIAYTTTTIMLTFSGWAVSVAAGSENTVALASGGLQSLTESGGGQAFILAVLSAVVGADQIALTVKLITAALVLSSLVAAVLIAGAVVRILAGLAQDGVLPPTFGVGADGRPRKSMALAVSVVTGLIALVAAAPDTPTGTVFIGITSGVGVTCLIAISSLATIAWFLRSSDEDSGFLGWEGRVVAAGFALVTMGFVAVFATYRLPGLMPVGDFYGWALPLVLGGSFACGLIVAAVLKSRDPRAIAQVGRSSDPEESPLG
ncbi:APC family permease [Cryptosporangium aurantiacum]|uniref:APC family permease n=1 Tax=Cryptosporangium aurantiacum TaxID=134849 RepID=UPI000934F6B4|nr:APC family permease [Cryptosporangium aurantiacum]